MSNKKIKNKKSPKDLNKIIDELQAENFRLKYIIETLPGSIYWKNQSGVYLGRNKTSEESLKKMAFPWEEKDVIGKTDYDLFPKEMADGFRKHDHKVMECKKESSNEEIAILPNGEKIIQMSTKRPLYNEQGEVEGIVGNTVDITYLKNIEFELRQAKSELEKSYKDKMNFLSIASHEIRGPVSTVKSVLEMIHDKAETIELFNEDIEYIKEAIKTCEKATNTIDYLIKMFNLKNEGDKTNLFLIKTQDFFEKIKLNFSSLNVANISITIDNSTPRQLYIDSIRLYEIMEIILNNSIRFANGNLKIGINISLENLNSSDMLLINISDNGKGISEPILKNLNTDLFEDDAFGTVKSFKNPPIRLAYVKKVLNILKGEIKISSQLKIGTNIALYIPYFSKKNESSTASVNTENSNQNTEFKKIKLLIVEDDPFTLKLYKKYLRELGYEFDAVCHGFEAVEIVQSTIYDLILLDIGLPDIDGLEARNLIQEKITYKPIYIAITSYASDSNKDIFYNSGFDIVLPKPINKRELKLCIDDILKTISESE